MRKLTYFHKVKVTKEKFKLNIKVIHYDPVRAALFT